VGADLVVVHCNSPARPFDPADYDASLARTRESLEALAPAARDVGVRLAVENMIPRIGRRPACDVREVLALIDGLGPHVGVCFDTGHNNATGADVPKQVGILGGKLFNTHIQDNHGRANEDEHLIPGDGTIDWDAFLDALDAIGFDSPRILEAVGRGEDGAFDEIMGRLAGLVAAWRARDQ
jgi:sugar phosphate isomerase/epimerase